MCVLNMILRGALGSARIVLGSLQTWHHNLPAVFLKRRINVQALLQIDCAKREK